MVFSFTKLIPIEVWWWLTVLIRYVYSSRLDEGNTSLITT